jgi:hypothetical protein
LEKKGVATSEFGDRRVEPGDEATGSLGVSHPVKTEWLAAARNWQVSEYQVDGASSLRKSLPNGLCLGAQGCGALHVERKTDSEADQGINNGPNAVFGRGLIK